MRATGLATADGTLAYARGFEGKVAPQHFRSWNGLTVSSIGFGTYLGPHDDRTDELYKAALRRAVDLGCNVVDTAVNYRFQRSERAIGEALAEITIAGGHPDGSAMPPQPGAAPSGEAQPDDKTSHAGPPTDLSRASFFISTKGGFFPFDGHPPADQRAWIQDNFVRPGIVSWDDVASGCHCMSPAYLKNQLEVSLRNLRLDAIDVYYLHNPETQLPEVGRAEFIRRIRAAFEFLETAAAEGKIGVYGTATWNGYRQPEKSPDHLSLAELEAAAREVAGEKHRFRALQLPVNLAMAEAIARPNQTGAGGEKVTLLEAASRLGMLVTSSGSIYQGQLARGLPPSVAEAFPGLETDAQRALQFARSAPGLTTALVGMKTIGHVEENLALARRAPATSAEVSKLFR